MHGGSGWVSPRVATWPVSRLFWANCLHFLHFLTFSSFSYFFAAGSKLNVSVIKMLQLFWAPPADSQSGLRHWRTPLNFRPTSPQTWRRSAVLVLHSPSFSPCVLYRPTHNIWEFSKEIPHRCVRLLHKILSTATFDCGSKF